MSISLHNINFHPLFSGDHSHLHRCVGHQYRSLQRSRSWWLMVSRCHLLLQDRCRSRFVLSRPFSTLSLSLSLHPHRSPLFSRRCHSRRSASSHHHLSRARHTPHGQEERHRSLAALRRDARLHLGHLLRQNRHTHHQSDVCLSRMSTSSAFDALPATAPFL